MAYLDYNRYLAAVRKCKWVKRGVDPVEAEKLYQSRTECAICEKTGKLFIDHCHSSKKIRGVLCQQCNFGLGNFKDDPALLAKAIAYLGNPVYN